MPVIVFFLTHWFASVFAQTFFLHRYGAHRMFTMSKGWERFFHLFTFLAQGSSYLDPRAYAILHREHHAFSDTARDPHSPRFFSNPFSMMWTTKNRYEAYAFRTLEPEARFDGGTPEWPLMERLGQSWYTRFLFVGLYIAFYAVFATETWMWALLPFHFVMGPVHGAIVNWCGHRYGYRNFASTDESRNTLPLDFVTLGELFQNNHHEYGQAPNFAARRFELDPAYQIMRILAAVGIIDFGPRVQRIRPAHESAAAEDAQAA
jgi:stearoyl-CoA desaturase (delta-9 desaturase)